MPGIMYVFAELLENFRLQFAWLDKQKKSVSLFLSLQKIDGFSDLVFDLNLKKMK